MKKLVMFLAIALSMVALPVRAVVVQDTPEPGKWCNNLNACLEYAEGHGMPLLVFWGNPGCGHCVTASNALNTAEFVDWSETRKLVMCFGEGAKDQDIKAFAASGSQKLSYYPFMCVYWAKAGKKPIKQNFSVLYGLMPVNQGPTLAGRIIASIEKYIKDYQYVDPAGGPVSFVVVGESMAVAANDYLYKNQNATIPLVAEDDKSLMRLTGTLSVRATAKNKLSARYSGELANAVVFTGTWSTIDLMTGEVVAKLERSGHELTLRLLKDGTLAASIASSGTVSAGEGSVDEAVTSEYDGSYSAFLGADDTQLKGTGVLSLTLKGEKATLRGALSDGTSLSVTAPVLVDGEGVLIPIYKTQSRQTVGLLISIDEDGNLSTGTVRGFVRKADGNLVDLKVTGGESVAPLSPAEVCSAYDLSTAWELTVDVTSLKDTGYGDALTFEPVALEAKAAKIAIVERNTDLASLSYMKKDGTISGKAKLWFDSGKSVTATIKGAILPDGKTGTVGFGTLYYADRQGGKSFGRSVPVVIRAK